MRLQMVILPAGLISVSSYDPLCEPRMLLQALMFYIHGAMNWPQCKVITRWTQTQHGQRFLWIKKSLASLSIHNVTTLNQVLFQSLLLSLFCFRKFRIMFCMFMKMSFKRSFMKHLSIKMSCWCFFYITGLPLSHFKRYTAQHCG